MRVILMLLVALNASLGTFAASPCLDPTDADYRCEVDAEGKLDLDSCDISDEDVDAGDLALCLDAAGRENIVDLYLTTNAITTLPTGMFQDLTALNFFRLWGNELTSSPDDILNGLTTLEIFSVSRNFLNVAPVGIEALTTVKEVYLYDNAITTSPAGIFEDLTNLEILRLDGLALECLPTLPPQLSEVDDDATEYAPGLHVDAYGTECGCSVTGVANVCGEGTCTAGPVGYTCAAATLAPTPAATPAPVIAATPAPVVAATPPPTTAPTPAATKAPLPAAATPGPSPEPPVSSPTDVATPAPTRTVETGAPASETPAPQASPAPTVAPTAGGSSTSNSMPMVAGIVSAAAGAALVAVAVLGKRRRDARQKAAVTQQQLPRAMALPVLPPPANDDDDDRGQGPGHAAQLPREMALPVLPPPANDDDNLEQGPGHAAQPPSYAASLASGDGGGGRSSPPPYMPEAGGHAATILPPPPPAVVPRVAPPSSDRSASAAGKDRDPDGLLAGAAGGTTTKAADQSAAETSTMTDTTSTATNSTANVSTAERVELAEFHRRQVAVAAGAASSVSGGPPPGEALGGGGAGAGAPSTGSDRQSSSGDIGLGQAVLAAAQELARSCQVPGISEAAGVLCVMANLFVDSRGNDKESESRLRQCRSMVLALRRAEKVVGKGGDTTEATARVLIEDVHDAIFDLVELIKTFQSKNKLSKVFLSTLFKRRQEELDAVVDRAITRLQLGLQLQVGHDMNSVRSSMRSVEDDVSAVRDGVKASSVAEAVSEAVAETRRIKRQRKLDQVEIPEDHLFITTDLLGKGGFGEVYLADYNGHNAAAKVLHIAHDLGALDDNQQQRETRQRKGFLRELEAMIRLRSPNTVNVFGAVTSLPDRMVLVMELLPNGDLLTLLRKSKAPLPEEQCRSIIGDICAGMAFLHSKDTIHGDLKSANVLLDGSGRAKIGDFGTSRWSQHTNSTGLATYTTKANQSTQMSLAWSAPEVLESGGSTYMSDVYSFGIVVWEVVSRELPWANKTRPRDILSAVLMGIRPSFHVDAPSDIVNIANACWGGEPEDRTTFGAILEDMKAKGWHE
eukprot:g16559.t1